MQIQILEQPRKIMANENSDRNYFAWPSIVKAKNGDVLVGASGYRMAHVCPFGKAVLSVSRDEGKTYTNPIPVVDTVLDDRDVGLCAFGESGLIVTSFNISREHVKKTAFRLFDQNPTEEQSRLVEEYYAKIPESEDLKVAGSLFRVSFDNGQTFGPIYHSEVQSPHGPIELKNKEILFVGTIPRNEANGFVLACSLNPHTGEMKEVGRIEEIQIDGERVTSCEPYALEMPDGRIVCHIRVQGKSAPGKERIFTLYQSESKDQGHTWSKPVPLLERQGGAPAHLFLTDDSILISLYSNRYLSPRGIYAMFSRDFGKTWEERKDPLFTGEFSRDFGYPMTTELSDHTLLTVFYFHEKEDGPAEIYQMKWRVIQ